MKTVVVYKPHCFVNQIGFLEGYSNFDGDNLVLYITNPVPISQNNDSCIGFCSESSPNDSYNVSRLGEWMHINITNNEIGIYNFKNIRNKDFNIICVNYVYSTFKHSEIVNKKYCGKHFTKLSELIQDDDRKNFKMRKYFPMLIFLAYNCMHVINFILKNCEKIKLLIYQSALLTHLVIDLNILKWITENVMNEKKRTVKFTNIFIAKVIDITLGVLALYYCFHYKEYLVSLFENSIEYVILCLKELLTVLKGSPAGLKLNYAFNAALVHFFLYNVSLWQTFVTTVIPILKTAFDVLLMIGVFGLSYQIALFTDVIKFITFHVYCIYVYAARLYHLQLKVLISLSRMFIGRKYNPLQDRVDTYEYTHHQLFIGILMFTIFLFLFPTTLLYYTVFTTFRITLVTTYFILRYTRFVLHRLPVYIIILWILNSPKITGAVFLEVKRNNTSSIKATLLALSIRTTLRIFLPGVFVKIPSLSLPTIIQRVFTGELF